MSMLKGNIRISFQKCIKNMYSFQPISWFGSTGGRAICAWDAFTDFYYWKIYNIVKNVPKMTNYLYDKLKFVIFLYAREIDKLFRRKYLIFVIIGHLYGHISIQWISFVLNVLSYVYWYLTKFAAYLSPSPTLFKHEMNIYWMILKKKVSYNEYSLYSMQNLIAFLIEMLSFNMGDELT